MEPMYYKDLVYYTYKNVFPPQGIVGILGRAGAQELNDSTSTISSSASADREGKFVFRCAPLATIR